MESKGFRKLLVWKRMTELILLVYKLTEKFPVSEQFGIISQVRRGVVSVLSNFVEGYLKSSVKEKRVYLERAQTCIHELEAQMEISWLLGYITQNEYMEFDKKKNEIGFLLYRYKSKV